MTAMTRSALWLRGPSLQTQEHLATGFAFTAVSRLGPPSTDPVSCLLPICLLIKDVAPEGPLSAADEDLFRRSNVSLGADAQPRSLVSID